MMTNKFRKLYETFDKFLQEKDISEIIKESSLEIVYHPLVMKDCMISFKTLTTTIEYQRDGNNMDGNWLIMS